jgi:hypothetical protein
MAAQTTEQALNSTCAAAAAAAAALLQQQQQSHGHQLQTSYSWLPCHYLSVLQWQHQA